MKRHTGKVQIKKKSIAIAFAAAAMMFAAQAPALASMAGLATTAPVQTEAQTEAVQKVGHRGGRIRIHFGHRFRHRHYRGHRRFYGCGRFYRKYKWTGSYYWLRRYRACKGWY